DALALTKLDVLDSLDRIDICTAYRSGGQTLTEFPSDVSGLAACEPVYESMPGWSSPTKGVTRVEDLPEGARRYREPGIADRGAASGRLMARAELVDRLGVGVGELDAGAIARTDLRRHF